MKLSRWNTYIGLGGKAGLIYNSFTDSYLAIKNQSDDFLHAVNGRANFFSKKFRDEMVQIGGLVDDEIDEVNVLEKLIDSVDSDTSTFHLIINPTLDCNLKCWYCYENHIKGSSMSKDLIDSVINLAESKVTKSENLRHFQLSFFGGEPLLCFDDVVKPLIIEITNICKKNGVQISVNFTTNAVLITRQIINFLKNYETSFQITIDGGRENHDNTRFAEGKAATFDKILDNVKNISTAGMYVNLRLNYTQRNIDSTSEVIEILSNFPTECRNQ